jgi:rare lipoprotein A (peptidoglycan hydrolase)
MVTRNYVVAQLSIVLCAAVISNADARSASYRSAYSAAERNAQARVASFYGDERQGRKTASGRRFDERVYTIEAERRRYNSDV